MNKSEAVSHFLQANTHPDLAMLYCKAMEVQVNVLKGNGKQEDIGNIGQRPTIAWTDGIEIWKPFRIPFKAMSVPEDNDTPIKFNLDKHVEGIGMTGWDWQNKVSRWVAYDFDSMLGHSDKHAKKLTDVELSKVQEIVTGLPYVTLRKSTSGRGLHLYIFLNNVPTANHTEHAALARSILSMIAGVTGYDFTDKVDICGGNMWVYHRKMIGTEGLKMIKSGVHLENIPANWRDHLTVVNKSSKRVVIQNSNFGITDDIFLELSGQRAKVKLDDDHLKLTQYLENNNLRSWWDADNHMLVCHTTHLRDAHKELGFRGEFHTNATGKDQGNDINCYLFPCRNGVWAVRRYGLGTGEHPLWVQDGKGYTRCFYNRQLTLDDVARLGKAVELEGGGYMFATGIEGIAAMKRLNVDVSLPEWIRSRPMRIKEARQDYRLAVSIQKMDNDNAGEMEGWHAEKSFYKRLFQNNAVNAQDELVALGDYDNMVRHIISDNEEDLGWVVSVDGGGWRSEPLNHVKVLLNAQGIGAKDTNLILGRAVSQAWKIVNEPFKPEYPGDRKWNRSMAKFKIAPSTEGEVLSYPTWQKVMDHCGESLNDVVQNNEWCATNGIRTGGDYLKIWFACLFKHPEQPLPFLALEGPQDSGKSTLHESVCNFILAGGYMDGVLALTSTGQFNGELKDTILCTLEETDLRRKEVYSRMKEWCTSPRISIHIKGMTPYKAPNYTHWIQCVNDPAYIPVFEGDKRVTVLSVKSLKEGLIPKRELNILLQKEAPDFLASLLSMDIPDSKDRLMLPVIVTNEKKAAEFESMTPVHQFLKEKTVAVDGAFVSCGELLNAYNLWAAVEGHDILTQNKFGREVPAGAYPRGRIYATGTQDRYYGNISLAVDDPPEPTTRWTQNDIKLEQKKTAPKP